MGFRQGSVLPRVSRLKLQCDACGMAEECVVTGQVRPGCSDSAFVGAPMKRFQRSALSPAFVQDFRGRIIDGRGGALPTQSIESRLRFAPTSYEVQRAVARVDTRRSNRQRRTGND